MESLSWTCCFVKLLHGLHHPYCLTELLETGPRGQRGGKYESSESSLDLLYFQEQQISFLYFWKSWLLDTSEANLNLGNLVNL